MKYILTLILLAFVLCMGKIQAQPPVAVWDTIHIYYFDDTVTVNVVKNDHNPNGNPFYVFAAPVSISHTDSTITYAIPYNEYHGYDGVVFLAQYGIVDSADNQNATFGKVFCWFHNPYYGILDINNVSARINNNGNHFWDLNNTQHYFVPKNSFHNGLFSFATWIAGVDANEQLHVAADRYGSFGQDYWSGPISNTSTYSHTYDSLWARVWKLSSAEINYHKTHWWIGGYQAPKDILTWPGNGNTALGQMAQLAPYHDFNNNGVYEPMAGDYPLIKGDQAVFFIQNDVRRTHTETQGEPLGIEIHGMAYAFNCPEDSALLYTTFLHYDIYNRSSNTYHDAALGVFVDIDLGYAWDDYVGSDVGRGSFFGYNGNAVHPYNDAISTTILGGPNFNPDGLDNPKVDGLGNPLCDYSINGANFNDGIIDNERYGMSSFTYFTNCASGPTCDPSIAADYYKFLNLQWKDGEHIQYGGNGHPNSGATGPDCNFMFPDTSDFCNWGTAGVQPPGFQTGAGGTGVVWNESNVGNPPDDRRGLTSMGPFTFEPNQKQELDVAFVWAADYADSVPWNAVVLLKSRIDQIRYYFQHDSTPCGSTFTGISNINKELETLRLYPNPANDRLYVEYANMGKSVYSIFGLAGNLVSTGNLNRSNVSTISLDNYKPGMYILVIQDGQSLMTRKFIKQ